MDKLSRFEEGRIFLVLSELYSEIFEEKISEIKFSELLKETFGEKTDKEKTTKKTGYEEEEDEEDEGNEEIDYVEVFKRKIVDYLLAAGFPKEGAKTIEIEYDFLEEAEHENDMMYSNETKLEVTNLEYENPVFFNRQWAYQRIFIKTDGEESVYSLTVKALSSMGMKIETQHDEKFNAGYVTSIDGRKDGETDKETGQRKFWEYWIINKETGEERIGEESVYEQKVKRNEMIEWRLATEQESGCGGGTGYDPQSLMSDPTINKLFLPGFMQTYISNLRNQRYTPMNFR